MNFDYKKSGVDLEQAEIIVRDVHSIVKHTFNDNVLQKSGGFCSLFSLSDFKDYKEPVIASSTDGVGSKINIAIKSNNLKFLGQDLLAMCVNDLITSGAKPLFLLDYIATHKLDSKVSFRIIKSISDACSSIGISLVGGETAEMPSVYGSGKYDLAGFIVGVVDKENIIDGKNIKKGDLVYGISSTGFHSNGYSLIQEVLFNKHNYSLNQEIFELSSRLDNLLLQPTKIYVDDVNEIRKTVDLKGLAHITGGGISSNISRILPEGLAFKMYNYKIPKLFNWFQKIGEIQIDEMFKVFNMGVGMAFIVDVNDASKIEACKEKYIKLGEII